MDYLNYDLRIADWNASARVGVAEVMHSPAGEGPRYPLVLDLDPAEYVDRILCGTEMAITFGKELARAVFCQENAVLWQDSYQIARERGRGLRLRLHTESWKLARLPWEFLYDERQGDFVVFDRDISLVRYLRLRSAPPVLRQSRALRVLVVAASPRDSPQLDWLHELDSLRGAVGDLQEAGQVDLIVREHITHDELHIALLENAPDVVHFIGHSVYDEEKERGALVLEDDRGMGSALGALEIARLLRRYGVRLVVLNACDTARGAWAGLAPALIRAEIPAVVAMQWPVEDRAAIRFSRAFYLALSMERTVDECVAEGRLGASASSEDPHDWAAPVLFLRSATGRLWTSDIARVRTRTEEMPMPAASTWHAAAVPESPEERLVPYFRTRGPLSAPEDAELLVDRPELHAALRLARQPSLSQYIALLSARDTGKTTLLLRLFDILQQQYVCAFIDLSVLMSQDARACYRFIAFRLISELWPTGVEPSLLPSIAEIESAVEFIEFMRRLAGAVSMPRIILILDEVGSLSRNASEAFFNTVRTVFMQGRGFDDHLAKYLFIFSGAVDLYSLTSGTTSPLNICEKLYLGDLERADVQRIVKQFARLGRSVSSDAGNHIYRWTSGHPYLTMRMCSHMENASVKAVNRQAIEDAAAQILVADDNIDYVIRGLERRPLERRRLQSILLEGRKIPFTRNDPVLASLEMIGVIRPSQPCQIRNRLYERALVAYYTQETPVVGSAPVPGTLAAEPKATPLPGTVYLRLEALHIAAREADGRYFRCHAWETFAAEFFSLVPAFSISPDLFSDSEHLDIVLLVNPNAPAGSFWATYGPRILVTCQDLHPIGRQDLVAEMARKARLSGIKLVLVMSSSWPGDGVEPDSLIHVPPEVCVVFIGASEVDHLLQQNQDLDTFLRGRVLRVRLGKPDAGT